MQIIDVLKSAGGGAVVNALATRFGISPAAATAAVDAIVPQLADRIERNTLSRGGLADIVSSLGDPRHARTLAHPEEIGSPATTADGVRVLDQLLWSKDKSRSVAAAAARQTGLGEDVLKSMLPAIASLTMGALAKSAGGPLNDILGRVARFGGSEEGGDMLPVPGQRTGRAPTRPVEVDDAGAGWPGGNGGRGAGGGWPGGGNGGGGGPLPLPGDGPYGSPGGAGGRNPLDDLSDILRRGGFNLPGGGGSSGGGTPAPRGGEAQQFPIDLPGGIGAGGGALWNIIRGILAAALGFQSRGVIGWILRMVVAKWGWRILQTILGGILGRRV